ncbi:MAG: hypothetical protein RIF41_29200 [Polyangiaceae bacterium]
MTTKPLVLLLLALVACGGDDVDDAACEQAATALCDASCACAPDCRIQFESGSTQGFGNETTSARDQCLSAVSGSCGDGMIEADACEAEVADANCIEDGDEPALELPAACIP